MAHNLRQYQSILGMLLPLKFGASSSKVLHLTPLIVQARHKRNRAYPSGGSLQTLKPVKISPVHRQKQSLKQKLVTSGNRNATVGEHEFLSDDDDLYEDDLASKVSQYSSKMDRQQAEDRFTRTLVKDMQTIKRFTIGKKYFKPASTPNLLTWAAKEQIKFLHAQNPEDWNTSALADTFPASEQAIKEVLKSKRRLYHAEDILRHDQIALSNWDELHSKLEDGDISDDEFERLSKTLCNSEGKNVMFSAVGDSELPQPCTERPPKQYGTFSSIVKDCLQDQEEQTLVLLQDKIPSVANELSLKLKDTSLVFRKLRSFMQKRDRRKTLPKEDYHSLEKDVRYGRGYFRDTRYEKGDSRRNVDSTVNLSRHSTKISGKNVYDDTGEFLYRIP